MDFTFEEMNLMSIYNSTGTRQGLISALREMSGYLESDETELRALTASALTKLESMSDDDFAALELMPDFDE
ncbi:transposon-transfer assisting family protein [Christensenellaceae bacterium OttesenSCG-928-L17]|nr:transposon-transfer assisting family protein [Christensenellaceae bacterium OttesenSCG-928-L17]